MNAKHIDEWLHAMTKAGATDPRNGRPSWNRLAEMSGVTTSTLTRAVKGETNPSIDTVVRIADALRVTPDTVLGWLERTDTVQPYEVPEEVHTLPRDVQAAITTLIKALAKSGTDSKGGEADGNAAPTMIAGAVTDAGYDTSDITQLAARRPRTQSKADQGLGRGLEDL